MRFIDAPFYVRQMIVVSFILTFVLAIIGLFASVRLCKKRRYIVLTAVTFALSFLSVFLTMCGSYLYRVGKSVFRCGRRGARFCGLRTCRRGALEQKAYFARVHKRERGFASGRNMFLRAKRTRAAYQYRNEPPLRSCNRQGTFGRRKFLAEGLARRNRGKLPAASNGRKTYHRIRGRQSGIVQEIFARDRRKNRL